MSLSWIQLSDIHFGQGRGVNPALDKALVLERLLEDAGHVREQLGAPDFVFVTGDIAHSGKRSEFDVARQWFAQLVERLEIRLDQVLLVPGNHDVDRRRTESPLERSVHLQMRRDPDLLSNLLDQDEVSVLRAKLTEYQTFSAEGFAAPPDQRSLSWKICLREGPAPVWAVGLNSALQCFDDDDDLETPGSGPNLQLSSWQIDRVFKDVPKDALLIVLLHHPPESLRDGSELVKRLSGRPFVLFYGHTHEQNAFAIRSLGKRGDHLCLLAGAGHDTSGETTHAYGWGFLNEDGLQWYPRQWSQASGSFVGASLDARDPEVTSRDGVGLHIKRSRRNLGRSLASWAARAGSRGSSTGGASALRNPFDPLPFSGARMTPAAMAKGALRLCQLVARYQYDPDVVIGMNQGGLVVASAMMQHWHNARAFWGGAFCVKRDEGPYEIRFLSLPGKIDRGGKWRQVRPKRILVADTKFKSGGSAKSLYQCLRKKFGEDVRIRFAVVLNYGGWPGRWNRPASAFPWPAQLAEDDRIQAYIACYTEKDPRQDDIREAFRPGWEWEWEDQEAPESR